MEVGFLTAYFILVEQCTEHVQIKQTQHCSASTVQFFHIIIILRNAIMFALQGANGR